MGRLREMVDSSRLMEKKFVRYNEGCEIYSMGRNSFAKLAKDAGAIYKVNNVVLVNTEIIDQYLENCRITSGEE